MKPTSIRLRSGTLDTIRGLTLVSMIVYHACWDLVYLYRLDWGWYRSFWAGIWQQSICCTFILLSGYCWQMGRHPLRRGLMSFFGGAAVSLATLLVLPETPVQFGVLTFLGSAALLTIPLRPLLSRIPPRPGLALSFAPFLVLRDVNKGFRPCRCPASVSAPELVCEHALRRTGLPRPQLRLLGLLSPAAVAVSLLGRVLSLSPAA